MRVPDRSWIDTYEYSGYILIRRALAIEPNEVLILKVGAWGDAVVSRL